MRLTPLSSRFLLIGLFSLFLASCGGGGTGGPLDDVDVPLTDDEVTASISVSMALTSAITGLAATTINSVDPGVVTVTLVNLNTGSVMPGQLVSVSVIAGSPIITPDSGEILTSTSGEAVLSISPGSSQAGAAILLLAEVDADNDGTADVSESLGFTVGSTNIALGFESDGGYTVLDDLAANQGFLSVGNGTSDLDDLGATSDTPLEVAVFDLDTGELVTTPVVVNFASSCALATVDTGVTTVNGIANSTFGADPSCSDVTVTASLAELGGATATGTISVAATAVNSIRFESATPTDIVLAGTGGTETSIVRFQVIDNAGIGKAGINVDFTLSTSVGGLFITPPTIGTSDADGFVEATLNSGSVPSAVQVVATVDLGSGLSVSSVSNSLVVGTGLPDQNSFSVAATILNPGGGEIDGIETEITLFASDAFNNPVPDDTVIAFTPEYGQIDSPCRTVDGFCSVIWNSAGGSSLPVDPLTGVYQTLPSGNLTGCTTAWPGLASPSIDTSPCLNESNFPNDQLYSGRNTILATTLGEESFVDANGSGLYDWIDADADGFYDIGETLEIFQDLDEAFVDENEDGVFGNALTTGACTSAADPDGPECVNWVEGGGEDIHVETFTGLAGNGVFDRGNGIYNGRLCHPELEAASLCTLEPILVRDSVVVVMSGGVPYLSLRDEATGAIFDGLVDFTAVGAPPKETLLLYMADFQNGRLPMNTDAGITVDNCKVEGTPDFIVPNTNDEGFSIFEITIVPDDTPSTGSITIEVQTPEFAGNTSRSISLSCAD